MIEFSSGQSTSILMFLFVFILIFLLNTFLIIKRQKRINFIHPGWILNIALFAYGFTTPFFLLIGQGSKQRLNIDFLGYYSFDNLQHILIMYIVATLSFTFGEIFLALIINTNNKQQYLANNTSVIEPTTSRFSIKILNLISSLLFLFGFFLMIRYYDQAGGFINYISSNRSARYEAMSQSGVDSFFTIIFNLYFLIDGYRIFRKDSINSYEYKKYIFMLIAYSIFRFVLGSRLEILLLFLSVLFLVYLLKPRLFYGNKRKITTFSFVLVLFSLLWQTGRSIIPLYLVTGKLQWELLEIVDFSRFETITGYIPGLIILESSGIDFYIPYLYKIFTFFPSFVLDTFSIMRPDALTKLISSFQYARTGSSVYTVTLPVDAYSSMGFIGIMIVSVLIYVTIYISLYKLTRKKSVLSIVGAIIFMNTFYVVRTEAGNWANRFIINIAAFYLIYLFYYFCSNILLRNRRTMNK